MGLTRREFVCATAAAGIGALAVPGRASAATLSSPLVGAKVREISGRARDSRSALRVTRRYYSAPPTEFTAQGSLFGPRFPSRYAEPLAVIGGTAPCTTRSRSLGG
jgi:hypothetical protein